MVEKFSRRKMIGLTGGAALALIRAETVAAEIDQSETLSKIDHGEFLKRKKRIEDATLMFHDIGSKEMTPKDQFKQHMYGLLESGYEPISLETSIRYLRGETDIPEGLKFFHSTLDDGLKSQLGAVKAVEEIAQETEKAGRKIFIPLTFYVMTQFEKERHSVFDMPLMTASYKEEIKGHDYMTLEDLLSVLSKGHRLENHTVNHNPNFSSMEVDAWKDEILQGERRINLLWQMAKKNREFKTFVFPHGRFNETQLQFLKDNGYNIAFGTDIATNTPGREQFAILRQRRS